MLEQRKDMGFFSPRLLRVKTECRVRVRLEDSKSAHSSPASCTAVLVNISQGGACLVLSKMLLEGRHLFFSTLKNERHHLVLLIENPESGDETFMVPACSVWMDSCHYKEVPAFKIGISFHEKQKELFHIFKNLGQ